MRHIALGLLHALMLLFLTRTSYAQKYNLSSSVEAKLAVAHVPPGTECDVPGICSPVSQTIPARTLWYWCGFYTTHRTVYKVNATSPANTALATMYMMRESQVRGCALKNVTWVAEQCVSIPESSCSSKSFCDVRLFGLVFPDPSCFVIINSRSSAVTVNLQVNNFFDSPRYYGTVFTLFFGVLGGLAILANIGYQFYAIIIAPVNRHVEPVKIKREDPVKKDIESDASSSSVAANTAAAGGGRPGWYQRIIGKLKPAPPHNA